jgi:hypothetical protein
MSLNLGLYFIYLLLLFVRFKSIVTQTSSSSCSLATSHSASTFREFGRQLGALVEQLLRRIHWLRLDLVALCW